MKKYFGTDGVRGIANKFLTPELAFNLAKAGGHVLKNLKNNKGKNLAVIGTDTRISKDMLKSALIAGFTSAGFDCIDIGVIPTPGIAYLTRYYDASCGVVVSASHNPMEYNGIKFFNHEGFKLADEIEEEIENHLGEKEFVESISGEKIGKLLDINDATMIYEEFIINSLKTDLKGYKVVLDTSNGASYKIAPSVFKKLGAEVIVTSNKPDGVNINLDCGSTNTKNLQKTVVENSADIGLAYDGDADRLIAVDEKGNIIDGDKVMLIIARYLKEKNMLNNNKLVVTVMSNLGLFKSAEKLGIDLEVTKVGDRYVLENMLENGYSIGGEQSGHIILLKHNTTGDGILTSLFLTHILKERNEKASELAKIMKVYPQVLVNVKVKDEYKEGYKKIKEVTEKIKEIEEKLDSEGRVLIRPSGTEPVIRIMIEGNEEDYIMNLAEDLASIISEKCI